MSSPVPSPTQGRTGKDHRELEWQLAATDLGAVRRWLLEHSSLDGLLIEPKATQHLHDTYFDTQDWRIHRAGFALRVRENGATDEATLKSLRSTRDDVADRRELNEELPSSGGANTLSDAPGPVGTRIQAVVGEHPLRPLFEVRTTRQRFALRDEQSHSELGEIALDETVISRPEGEPQANLTRVEIEAASSEQHAPLEKLVKTLRAHCALSPAAENKYALGLKSVGLLPSPAPRLTPDTVDASMTAAEAALANLRRLLSDWFTAEPGARLGDDPEQLHHLRVSARRMAATLSLFAAYLPSSLTDSRGTLKDLLDVLGAARDLDVHLAQLRSTCLGLSNTERERAESLLQHLEAERSSARARMLRALDSGATRQWLEKLTQLLAQPSLTPETSTVKAVAAAPQLIRSKFRKLRKAIGAIKPDSSTTELHALRLCAKKLRYAIESVAVIYGKPADEMLRALRRLQDRLGVQQDAHVIRDRLIGLATHPPEGFSSQTVFLMGALAERAMAHAPGRKRIEKTWRKVRGRRWKALRAKMQELRPSVARSTTAADTHPDDDHAAEPTT